MKPKRKQDKTLPYRYVLPRDLQEVKLVAYMQGVLNAYEAKVGGFDDTRPGYRELAATIAQDMMLTSTEQDKQGTNHPELFREVFVQICSHVHQVTTVMFEQAPETYDLMTHATEARRREIGLNLALQKSAALEAWKPGEFLDM